ncbi:putative methyltransferase 235L [Halotydeus destructor]|nr:putative methyltransferase 235L [Halotydeus destructor]
MEYGAEMYDKDSVGQLKDSKRFLTMVKKMLGNKSVDSAVDLGCGVGNVTKLMADQLDCNSMTGIDVDAEMVRYARAKYPSLKFHVADFGSRWPFFKKMTGLSEQSVDLVVSTYSLHWMYTDQQRENAMTNVKRMLKHGGQGHFLIVPWTSISHLYDEYLIQSKYSSQLKNIWLEESDNWQPIWSKVCSQAGLDITRFQVSTIQFEAKVTFLDVLFRWHLRTWRESLANEDEIVDDFLEYVVRKVERGTYSCSQYQISEGAIGFNIDTFELHVRNPCPSLLHHDSQDMA